MAAEKIKPQQISKPRRKPQTKTAKIHKLIEAGCHKVTTIARAVDCNHALVSRVLSNYNIQQDQLDSYKTHRADILAGVQHRLLNSITSEDIKKAPLGTRVLAAAQLYDKERIERGLSNGDQPIMVIIRDKPQPVQVEGKVVDIPKVEQDNLLITPET